MFGFLKVLFLSEDSICLGDIPVRSQYSRILFLTNVSRTYTAYYTWDLTQHSNHQVQESAKVASFWLA